MKQLRQRFGYANVASTIALVGVLGGGGAYAASKIGPGDIEANAVRTKHIKANAVGTEQIRNGAVTGAKLAEAVGRGERGGVGPPGPPGPPGAGAVSAYRYDANVLQNDGWGIPLFLAMTELTSKTINLEQRSTVRVEGRTWASVNVPSTYFCEVRLDGNRLGGGTPQPALTDQTIEIGSWGVATAVPAGSHTFALACGLQVREVNSLVYEAEIYAEAIPD